MKTLLPQSGAWTHEQVAEEIGLGYTDPNHHMYRWRGTAKFQEWCDALYHRIPLSNAKVTPGDIAIGAPMIPLANRNEPVMAP
jgi:hypothetical protein